MTLAIGQGEVVIISDRHQGIIRIVLEIIVSECHAHCYHHIKEYFSSILTKINTRGRKEKKIASKVLKKVAYAGQEIEYDVVLDLAKWVEENNLEDWVMSKF